MHAPSFKTEKIKQQTRQPHHRRRSLSPSLSLSQRSSPFHDDEDEEFQSREHVELAPEYRQRQTRLGDVPPYVLPYRIPLVGPESAVEEGRRDGAEESDPEGYHGVPEHDVRELRSLEVRHREVELPSRAHGPVEEQEGRGHRRGDVPEPGERAQNAAAPPPPAKRITAACRRRSATAAGLFRLG